MQDTIRIPLPDSFGGMFRIFRFVYCTPVNISLFSTAFVVSWLLRSSRSLLEKLSDFCSNQGNYDIFILVVNGQVSQLRTNIPNSTLSMCTSEVRLHILVSLVDRTADHLLARPGPLLLGECRVPLPNTKQ